LVAFENSRRINSDIVLCISIDVASKEIASEEIRYSVYILGIDVAPKKGGHIYDGEPSTSGDLGVTHKSPERLEQYLTELPQDVLIAWTPP
jgi:hypothetical protein